MTLTITPQQGWQCPACCGVYAPWVARCLECKPKPTGLRDRAAAAQRPTPRVSDPLPIVEGGGTDAGH